MSPDESHFEVFARASAGSPWSLEFANESRDRAIEAAEEMLLRGLATAVKVCKETLDPETREFGSVVVMSRKAG